MNSETMPDELWGISLSTGAVIAGRNKFEDSTRYIRADRIDPAILAAMDETLSYFDGSTGSEEDTPIHSWVPHGLTVGMLRTFRGILG